MYGATWLVQQWSKNDMSHYLATTVAQHAVLDIATTHVSCKASTCFCARIVTMVEHLGSNWTKLIRLATTSFDYTHCSAKQLTMCCSEECKQVDMTLQGGRENTFFEVLGRAQ